MKTKLTSSEKGAYYEEVALQYLVEQGMALKERNYLCKLGELDLIMFDKTFLVVVEVRYRKNSLYGGALESITTAKQKKIIAATQYYCQQLKIKLPIRFDVVGITGNNSPEWVRNAF